MGCDDCYADGSYKRLVKPIDWRKALAWYMFHVIHEEGVDYTSYGMSCMPPEYSDAIRVISQELQALTNANGQMTKPDGSAY